MIKMQIQFFGGRGSSSAGGGAELGESSGKSIEMKSKTDIWTMRHNTNNADYVDSINASVRAIQGDFDSVMDSVPTVSGAVYGKGGTGVLGTYSQSNGLTINQRYTNVAKMNDVYDKSVASGFHPSRGKYNGVQAVTFHEMGHALTQNIADRLGFKSLDASSKEIVQRAMKTSKFTKGSVAYAKQISGYAGTDYAECVAEAVADYYCNGSKASSASKAIVREMKKMYK